MRTMTKMLASSAMVAAAMATAPNSAQGVQKQPRADMSADVKAAITDLTKTFEAFKQANDERIDGVVKGFEDVIDKEKVDRINTALDDAQDAINKIVEQQKQHELGFGGAPDAIDYVKAAKEFSVMMSGDDVAAHKVEQIDPEAYKAYSENIQAYYRRGDKTLPQDVKALMEVGSDPDGGYLVPVDSSGRIVAKVYETSEMRQYASVTTIGTDRLEGFIDDEEASSGWVGEKETRSETTTPGLGKWEIPVHEVYAMPAVTQKLLDDAGIDIVAWLEGKVSSRFARQENTAFVTGDSMLKPKGVLTYDTSTALDASRAAETFQHILSGASGALGDPDRMIELVFALKRAYRQNANWFMNRSTVGAIRKLKDGQGNYLWQPNFEERQGGLLVGYGIGEMEDFPDIASGAQSVAFGDMRETYQIVDRTGIRVLRDPLTTKGRTKFYSTKRVGGAAIEFDSLKFLKIT